MKICAVSYLNTRPFLYGLHQEFSPNELEISTQVPSACANAFAAGEADLALVPIATLPELNYPPILEDWCIGAEGKVDSVFICSNQEIANIKYLVQDQHSRTSNMLSAILLRNHWKQEVEIKLPEEGAWLNPESDTAYVIIGDKAVLAHQSFQYVYDLAEEWKKYSGLPFVFAVWVHRDLSVGLQDRVRNAFQLGMQHLRQVADESASDFQQTPAQVYNYFTVSLSYPLDNHKKEAIQRFLAEASRLG